MSYSSIRLHQLSLSFPNKGCFENFSATILTGSRIAIIGRNGSGKSSLLRILAGEMLPSEGSVFLPAKEKIGYVPQIILDHSKLSGAQRFQRAFTQALAKHPEILLLDEPTNHLDQENHQSLFNLLRHYVGTVIVVSHDVELLQQGFDQLWHIDQGKVQIFSGNYEDYQAQLKMQRARLEQQREQLRRQQESLHQKRMQEQERSAKSKTKGQKSIAQRKWPTVVSAAKANRAASTAVRKLAELSEQREQLSTQLAACYVPEIIVPTFHLGADQQHSGRCVSIYAGAVGYEKLLLTELHLSLNAGGKMAIVGNNGSGKSTLFKAILGDPKVAKSGEWHVPKPEDIGYLDQHYQTLQQDQTVLQTLEALMPRWSIAEIRQHLSSFLFRSAQEVSVPVAMLSGGERVRLCLAQIAAKPPRLLLLDEITNNVDLETRAHLIEVLRSYPGAMMVVSHDQVFLNAIGIDDWYHL